MFSATLRPGATKSSWGTSTTPASSASRTLRNRRGASVDGDFAFIGTRGIDAGDDFHQGRFAGAVLADHTDSLARPHHQIDVGDGLNAREGLADMDQAEHRADGSSRRGPAEPTSRVNILRDT